MTKLSGNVTFNIISKILFGTDFKAEDVMVDVEKFDGTFEKLNYFEAMHVHTLMSEETYLSVWVVLFGFNAISWNMG